MNTTPAQIYSAEQIRIPPELPEILKNYCKHIIRNKPDDIYVSSQEYFTKLAAILKGSQSKLLSLDQLRIYFKKVSFWFSLV
jgi:hypothetical protein